MTIACKVMSTTPLPFALCCLVLPCATICWVGLSISSDFMQGWQASLVEKTALEAQAKAAALDAAKADLETHALERAAKMEAKMSRNREQEQARRMR